MKEIIITIFIISLINTILCIYKDQSSYSFGVEWTDVIMGGICTWILLLLFRIFNKPLNYLYEKYESNKKKKIYSEKKIEKICYKIIKNIKKDKRNKYKLEDYYDLNSFSGDYYNDYQGLDDLVIKKSIYEHLNNKFYHCIHLQKEQTIKILEKYFIPVTKEKMNQDNWDEYYIKKYKDKGLVKIK